MALQDDSGEVNRANADLKTSLENADPKVKLAIANFRGRSGFSFAGLPETQPGLYKVEAATLDFSSLMPLTASIPGLAKTEGKIPKIDRIAPDEVLF